MNYLAARLNSLLKKYLRAQAFPQRLEAAIDLAQLTARVELVPFPLVPYSRVFQQTVKPSPFKAIARLEFFRSLLRSMFPWAGQVDAITRPERSIKPAARG